MQLQRAIRFIWRGLVIDEDSAAFCGQLAGAKEFSNRSARPEPRANLDQRFRPETPTGIQFVKALKDVRSADFCERPGETFVILDDGLIQVEDVHRVCFMLRFRTANGGKIKEKLRHSKPRPLVMWLTRDLS